MLHGMPLGYWGSHRLLGGIIGSCPEKIEYVGDLVKKWISELECLAMIASSQSQAAFAAFTKSVQFWWTYVQQVIGDCQSLFENLETVIQKKFLPTIMRSEVSDTERILSLPAKWGGLGVSNPIEMAATSFTMSRRATDIIVQAIKGKGLFELDAHINQLTETRRELSRVKDQLCNDKFEDVLGQFDTTQQRAILRARNEKISGWLTVLPLAKSHFDLSPQEFWDALAIRYKKPLRGTPELCDGCGAQFNLSHALSCRKGGLVTHRHNEVRDTLGDLASLIWSNVKREPIVREADNKVGTTALVADIAIRGVWMPQAEALFDVRVINTDAQSYSNRTTRDVLQSAEKEKKAKYVAACEERRASFMPVCCSVDEVFGKEAEVFLKMIGEGLSTRWDRSYSEVMGWVRARMLFAILRATILCLRGARAKWRCLGLEDGTPLRLVMS